VLPGKHHPIPPPQRRKLKMNKKNRVNEGIEGLEAVDDIPVTGAIVLKGKCGLLVRFFKEMDDRNDFRVVFVRMSPGRLYIVGEDGR